MVQGLNEEVMANTELQVWQYEDSNMRAKVIDGVVWIVANDVCDYFGETNRNRAMQMLDEDEKGYTQMSTPRRRSRCCDCK